MSYVLAGINYICQRVKQKMNKRAIFEPVWLNTNISQVALLFITKIFSSFQSFKVFQSLVYTIMTATQHSCMLRILRRNEYLNKKYMNKNTFDSR